ncbi:MAG: hypothetical protein ABW098_00100 [Candidatus Thiodiazotropha sp.]
MLAVCWLPTAKAFFCFSFGGKAKYSSHHSLGRYPLPPPPLMPYYTHRPWLEPKRDQAVIATPKETPVIIQGYRFRPLQNTHPNEQLLPAVNLQK